MAPIDHVYGTLELVRALTTQEYTDRSGIREKIEGQGSFTLFAPSNEAWDNLDSVSESKTIFMLQRTSIPPISCFFFGFFLWQYARNGLLGNVNVEMYNALQLHMVNRRLLTKDLKNHMVVKSMYNDRELYISHYSNGVSSLTLPLLPC